jgi:hypothetical protein
VRDRILAGGRSVENGGRRNRRTQFVAAIEPFGVYKARGQGVTPCRFIHGRYCRNQTRAVTHNCASIQSSWTPSLQYP